MSRSQVHIGMYVHIMCSRFIATQVCSAACENTRCDLYTSAA